MSIATLPTDNLYKFMAIFGLSLIVSSTTFPLYFYQTVSDTRFRVKEEIAVQRVEYEAFHALLENNRRKREKLLDFAEIRGVDITSFIFSKPKSMKTNGDLLEYALVLQAENAYLRGLDSAKLRIYEDMSEDERKLLREADIESRKLELKKQDARLKTQKAKLSSLEEQMYWLVFLAVIGAFSGIICSSAGFYLWHSKVQVPQDMTAARRG